MEYGVFALSGATIAVLAIITIMTFVVSVMCYRKTLYPPYRFGIDWIRMAARVLHVGGGTVMLILLITWWTSFPWNWSDNKASGSFGVVLASVVLLVVYFATLFVKD